MKVDSEGSTNVVAAEQGERLIRCRQQGTLREHYDS
jgi:hypothetical protein